MYVYIILVSLHAEITCANCQQLSLTSFLRVGRDFELNLRHGDHGGVRLDHLSREIRHRGYAASEPYPAVLNEIMNDMGLKTLQLSIFNHHIAVINF